MKCILEEFIGEVPSDDIRRKYLKNVRNFYASKLNVGVRRGKGCPVYRKCMNNDKEAGKLCVCGGEQVVMLCSRIVRL